MESNELEYMQEVDDTPEDVKTSKRVELIRKLKSGDFTLSHSSFNEFCKSPKHFIDYKLKDKVTTPSMAFGSMVHCSILEPADFENRYFVMPECDGRTKEGKLIKIQAFEDANGREIVNAKDYAAALRIGDSIRRNDPASVILDKCTAFEVDVEWEYKGFKWRGKMDGDGRKNKIILDLKVLADVAPRAVANYVKYEGAGRQAVQYLKSADEDCEYYILAVDRSGNCSVSRLGKGLLQQLSREIDWYIAQFKKCLFLGEWGSSYDFYSQDGYFKIDSL
jgi:hypothetical protein